MLLGSVDEQQYIEQMNSLSRLMDLYYATITSKPYKIGSKITNIKKRAKNLLDEIRLKIKSESYNNGSKDLYDLPNYFSNERVAVYTCFFGNYDILEEPFCRPNNVDYYVITDQPISSNSVWKKMDIKHYERKLEGYSNVEKNRWFKMFPHLVFTQYRYSVYIDGNVVPVTDFTEFVNKIKTPGVAMHKHSANDCVYQEALYNKYRIKKTDSKEIDLQVNFLKKKGMPAHYGMTTCNVIARDHSNEICRKLMEDWWNEFITRCRRDQMSFPYVAWSNGVEMKQIAQLGDNAWGSRAFYIKRHVN